MNTKQPTHRKPGSFRRTSGILVALGCLVGVVRTTADAATPDPAAAKWLVDRARGYECGIGDNPSVGDARVLLVWMRAASRVAPSLPDAWIGQYNLYKLLGREDDAHEALAEYCKLVPDDEPRQLTYLSEAFSRLQSAEKRIAFCEDYLGQGGLTPAVASEFERWLAETYRGVGDLALAKKHAEAAIRVCPLNFGAHQMGIDLRLTSPTPGQQAALLLSSIAATGGRDADQLWALAGLLDSLSLHERAGQWYSAALAAFGRARPGLPPPAELLLDMARSARDAGQPKQAAEYCRQTLQADPDSYHAMLLLAKCIRAGGDEVAADEQLARTAAWLADAAEEVRKSGDALGAAWISWFHIEHQPDTAQALEFAEIARAAAPDDHEVALVYGLALLKAGKLEEARLALAPLADGPDGDQLAAWGLARTLLQLGDQQAALEAARDAEQLRRSGMAYEWTVELLRELGAAPLPMPDRSKVTDTLDAFNRDVLDFAAHPERYVSLTAEFVDPAPTFGRRWLCRFTFSNKATFPVTMGSGQMVGGQVLIFARPEIAAVPPVEGYIAVPINRRHILPPGQSIVVEETLDVGPVAVLAASRAQRQVPVSFAAILDPVRAADGGWVSAFGSELTATARLVRQPVRYAPDAMKGLVRRAREGSASDKVVAMRTVVGLLDERLAVMRQAPDYQPARVDRNWLQAMLAAGQSAPDPIVRAGVLDAVTHLPFDAQRVQSLAPMLADPDWLVRMSAVQVLATRQGPSFRPVAERLAQSDPDELVRELARLHVDGWQADEIRGVSDAGK